VLHTALEAGEHGKKASVNLMESNALKRVDTQILVLFREIPEHVPDPHEFHFTESQNHRMLRGWKGPLWVI